MHMWAVSKHLSTSTIFALMRLLEKRTEVHTSAPSESNLKTMKSASGKRHPGEKHNPLEEISRPQQCSEAHFCTASNSKSLLNAIPHSLSLAMCPLFFSQKLHFNCLSFCWALFLCSSISISLAQCGSNFLGYSGFVRNLNEVGWNVTCTRTKKREETEWHFWKETLNF